MATRLYATLAEFCFDLELPGVPPVGESKTLDRIRAASDFIDKRVGRFVPVTEARRFDGRGGIDLYVPALLAVTALTNDATALAASDYTLYPLSRHYENGPYTRIAVAVDASGLGAWSVEREAILVTGRWGMYEETQDTGATVRNNPLAAGDTALLVANGTLVSPGMVLKIESEQALVTATGAVTDSTTTLNGALDDHQTDVTLADGTKVAVGEVMRVGTEDMRVEVLTANAASVTRGWNGTPRASHLTAATVYVYRTYTIQRGVNGTTAAAHVQGVAISRYIAPYEINWLVRQIAGLMHKKAKGGFAGKNANAEMTEIFYHDEFPKKQLDDVAKFYRLTQLGV